MTLPAQKPAQTYVDHIPPCWLPQPFRGADADFGVLQVGIVAAVIPDPNHPEFSVYWLRDACLVYHPWLNELTVSGDTSLRPQLDDVVHALTRTQQVISLAGNVFTGGIDEAVFGVHLERILDEKTRIGSPAAGAWIFRGFVLRP
jgi:glucoamylase